MRVLLLDDVRVARRVVGARRESFDEPRWYAGLAEHDDHRGGEVLAEVLPQIEEEVLDRVLPGRRRLHLGRVRIRRAPQEGLKGLRFVVCIWDVVQKAVSECPHSRRHGRWQLQVLRLDVVGVRGRDLAQGLLVGGRHEARHGVRARGLRPIQRVKGRRIGLVRPRVELVRHVDLLRLVRREEDVRVRNDDVEAGLVALAIGRRERDLIGLVALGRAPSRTCVEVVGHRTPKVAGWRLDGHDHAIAEVRSLPQTDGIGERNPTQAARSRYAGEEPLPLCLDAVVRTLERAPGAVQHLGRSDAWSDERHDHEHGGPGQSAAQEAPIHLA